MTAAGPDARISRRYRERTLILETSIETSAGFATIVDFMPPRSKASGVVRLVLPAVCAASWRSGQNWRSGSIMARSRHGSPVLRMGVARHRRA